jgi:hypothetical protein
MLRIHSEVFFFVLTVIGFELRASSLVGRLSTTLAPPPALFMLGIFKIGSLELFGQAGL